MADKRLKLIWDFFGADALPTAKHHAIHLKEFTARENLEQFGVGTEEKESHTEAYIIVAEKDMISVRDALKPNRGEWVTEE